MENMMPLPYEYNVYNNQFKPRRFIQVVKAHNMNDAIKYAGFDWIENHGGKIVKTRRGAGYTNAKIEIYSPETMSADIPPRPDFVMERIFD